MYGTTPQNLCTNSSGNISNWDTDPASNLPDAPLMEQLLDRPEPPAADTYLFALDIK